MWHISKTNTPATAFFVQHSGPFWRFLRVHAALQLALKLPRQKHSNVWLHYMRMKQKKGLNSLNTRNISRKHSKQNKFMPTLVLMGKELTWGCWQSAIQVHCTWNNVAHTHNSQWDNPSDSNLASIYGFTTHNPNSACSYRARVFEMKLNFCMKPWILANRVWSNRWLNFKVVFTRKPY